MIKFEENNCYSYIFISTLSKIVCTNAYMDISFEDLLIIDRQKKELLQKDLDQKISQLEEINSIDFKDYTPNIIAKNNNVSIGAHPSFNDPENFGRKRLNLSSDEINKLLIDQYEILQNIINIYLKMNISFYKCVFLL